MSVPSHELLPYQSCYCEENVYHLARLLESPEESQSPCSVKPDSSFVVLVTNPSKQTPFFFHGPHPSGSRPVIWDYHVFLISVVSSDQRKKILEDTAKFKTPELSDDVQTGECNALVWDADASASHIPFPCPFDFYKTSVLKPCWRFGDRCYRVVPASVFLSSFCSDRSHMLSSEGAFMMPPPSWPAIQAEGMSGSNLDKFLDVSSDAADANPDLFGTVMTEEDFFRKFQLAEPDEP
mmetsp:Transcript_39680/g.99918  ORF Transcript_39680/g.99918 Transcript_39680/m.99918 type:complete len:237 (-) Transcript_39680:438-1148(-)|eukprot:CAMPEP_0177633908 /NCGR_PEP_ID=MMETSP0447-20121125/3089_1 /TAXON_ID=0 /ORGANISM="Stygamoeba regulata, Strain BSH-02190019" /LENGTH=236 /DNA_ID=CAMNT_0019135601 /DNA_START=31 /DNA_END=741 /DNA_ORIENTATION=-